MDTAHVLEPVADDDPSSSFPLSNPARAILAVLSMGAAVIHLVMVPTHAGEWLPQGIAFALAGWFQIGFAIAIIAKPAKRLLTLTLAVNLAFIAAWAVTRTAGLPFGPDSGIRETASFVDLTCVGLEAALVLACLVFAAKPRLGEDIDTRALVAASVVPIGVIMLTTTVLASPDARSHGHGGGGDATNLAAGAGGDHHADHGGAPMDHSNGAMDHSNGAMDHSNGAMDHSDGHMEHGNATPAASRCDWEFNTTTFWEADPPEADDGHAHEHGSPNESANPPAEGTETVGNKAGLQWWKPMTNTDECKKLKADLAVMESMAKKYPTAQSALDAGCIQVTVYVPGIARHIACFKYWMDDGLDVNTPEMLLYGGNQPWAPMVGLSYYTYAPTAPGVEWQFGQMPFHVHKGLCVKGTLVIGGDGSDKESCEARGGKVMGKTGYMGHYWLPSCSSPDGVFSADNPRLDMGVPKYNDDPKFDPANGGDPTVLQADPCAGSKMTDPVTFGAPASSGSTENASAPTK
jgi:hypothetical protein